MDNNLENKNIDNSAENAPVEEQPIREPIAPQPNVPQNPVQQNPVQQNPVQQRPVQPVQPVRPVQPVMPVQPVYGRQAPVMYPQGVAPQRPIQQMPPVAYYSTSVGYQPSVPPAQPVPPIPPVPPVNVNNNTVNENKEAEVEKEDDKSKKSRKRGTIIAIVLVSLAVIALIVVTILSIGKAPSKKSEEKTTVDAVVELSDTPNGEASEAAQIYQKTYESNVGVLVYSNNQSTIYAEGSGVILPTTFANEENGENTYIVTCAHVLESSSSYKTVVQIHDGTQYDATIVGVDKKTDIGVLRISATGLKAAEFADSSTVNVGDTVYALGNPGGSTFFGSFTNGMVSAIGRPIDSPVGYEVPCIQHTAPINPGNSGGALLNAYGQVIGINSSKIAAAEFEGMGFAVPTETVKEIVESILENGYVIGRPALGVTFYPSTYSKVHSALVKNNDLPAGSIIIYSINDNSDLVNKDVQVGDMIIGYNGKPLDDYNDLLDLVDKSKVGDVITLEICRTEQNREVKRFKVDVKLVEDTANS